MTIDNLKRIPRGLFAISGFVTLLILDVVYDNFYGFVTDLSYVHLSLLLVPLYIYIAIGVIKPLPKARNVLLFVIILLFLGTISQFISLVSIGYDGLTNSGYLLRAISGLVIPLVIFFYQRKEEVKSYLEEES